ncbi:MAG: accessory Sec system protein translocase subunit SecY2 [Cardiobacteriaceae bacterium]|nr:accessory Sec system protein translocase subunit SecY2 [Cardiobacteriaceae bacterium]
MKFRSNVKKKILGTIFLIFVYVLGSKLTLPFVDLTKSLSQNGLINGLELTSAVMGGGLRNMNIFSLGLSPWMSSMLLWKMFTVSKKLNLDNLPTEILERRKMYLTLAISLIQGLAITLYLPLNTSIDKTVVILLNTLILVAGSFFLIWMADINSIMGLGSSTIIMMVGMMLYLPADLQASFRQLHLKMIWVVGLFIFSLILLYVAIIFERAMYKIPINKIAIHNEFKNYSYLDIKINPAGGMPIIYAMTLVSIPQYILLLVTYFFPKEKWSTHGISAIQMGKPMWFILYIGIIFLLGIGFAYINVNGDEISEKMQRNSEYIDGIYPGDETRKYINHIVKKFGILGSCYLIIFTVMPMLVILWDLRFLRISMVPGIFMIFFGMVFMIKEEVKALSLNEKYTKIF